MADIGHGSSAAGSSRAVAVPAAAERSSTGATVADEPTEASLRRSAVALVLVGVGYFALQHILMRRSLGLALDESNYLAMVNPRVPELYWTEVRAWGMPLLAAPVGMFDAGTTVVRVYFSALSSVGLVAAFWPWRRMLHPAVAPLGALLFATTWFAVFFGLLVMPNLYVALGAVATTGLFVRSVMTGRRRHILGAAAAAGFVALVRPSDSVLLLVGVLPVTLAVPRLRRWPQLLALVGGAALGWVPWVVEAYLRFGGPLTRLRGGNSSGLRGGVELNLTNLLTYPRVLDGAPTYCCYGGPASGAGPLRPILVLWFVAIPLAAMLGLVVAARRRRLPEVAVAAAPAGVYAAFYLLLLTFAGVRFLLPVLALASIPVATFLVWCATTLGSRRRPWGAGLVAVGVAAHLGLAIVTAERRFPEFSARRAAAVAVADAVRPLVTSRPCTVVGRKTQAESYYLGCRPQSVGASARPPARVAAALEQGGSAVAILKREPPARGYLSTWQRVTVPNLPRGWAVYVPPAGAAQR